MLISTFYGDAFDGQFALRLKESARLIDLECTLYKWGKDGAEADKARLRSKLLARSLQERREESILRVEPRAPRARPPPPRPPPPPGVRARREETILLVEPDAQILRRPGILLDEEDFDVAVYY